MDEIGNKKSKCIIVIPSRLNSSRLPEKALIKIDGKPLIQRVVEIARGVGGIDQVIVATDSTKIASLGEMSGAESILTNSNHQNGTERLLEVMKSREADYYINLQGDEPLIDEKEIEEALNTLMKSDKEILTICRPISLEEAKDPSKVKVIISEKNKAIYFSRAIVPYNQEKLFEHSGVYLFKKGSLRKIEKLKSTALERSEKLEQLRWLEAGISIEILIANKKSISIDTPEDLIEAERIIKIRKIKSLILDVDGVLTDGKLSYGKDGELIKVFSSQDGSAIKRLQNQGYTFALLSGRDSEALRARAKELGIQNMILGTQNKLCGIESIQEKLNLKEEEIAYIGDDIEDIIPMNLCGWSFAVANAREEVKSIAKETLKRKGGEGVIAEVESILNKINGISLGS